MNSRIKFEPAASGAFRIIASAFSSTGKGSYSITISEAAGVGRVVMNVQGNLTAGDLLENDRYRKTYDIALVAGRRYTFDLSSDKFDTYLKLHNPQGTMVAFDDDSGSGLNARMFYTPSANGMFRVTVTSYAVRATGPFTLTVREQ